MGLNSTLLSLMFATCLLLCINHRVVASSEDEVPSSPVYNIEDQQHLQHVHSLYNHTNYSHNCWSIVIVALVAALTHTLQLIVTPTIAKFFQKNVAIKKPIDHYSNKAARTFYLMIYHSFLTYYGYHVLQRYLPWQLHPPDIIGGGSTVENTTSTSGGTTKIMSIDEAFQIISIQDNSGEHNKSVELYSLVALGYHFGSAISHLLAKQRKSDYFEMLLHHTVTLVLFGCMIISNHIILGCTIAYLHNIADIIGSAIKCCSSTRYDVLSVLIFLTMMFVWGWTRLYVLPQIIYKIMILGKVNDSTIASAVMICCYRFSTLLLGILQALHIYWFYLFIVMLIGFCTHGSTDDIQSQPSKPEQQQKATKLQ